MRAVFFDLDGTLVELPDDFAAVFESALRECGVAADAQRHERYLDAFFGYLDECHPEPYRMAMADLREACNLDPSAEALADAYAERETAATRLRPGAREVLDALDSRTSDALGVLTNGAARVQRRKLAHHGIADYFDAVVVSGDAGAGKPAPEIFATATETVPADEYVFVADDLERDVLPAQEVGFAGVHLADGGGEAGDGGGDADDGEADETVASLREVPDLLAGGRP